MKKIFSLFSVLAVSVLMATTVMAGDSNVKTLDLKVVGMHCGGCEGKVKASLSAIDGVKEVASVSAQGNSAILTYDADKVSEDKIVEVLKAKTGYVVSVNESGAKEAGTVKSCCKGSGKTCTAAEKAACDKSKSKCDKSKSE